MKSWKVTRRQLAKATGLALVGTGLPLAVRAQTSDSAGVWVPADGLRLAGPAGTALTMDPALARDYREMSILRQIFRGLLSFTTEMETAPDLASKMDVNPCLMAFTFTLDDNARFHDGRAITSDDVHASFFRALDPATAGGDPMALTGVGYLQGILGADEVISGTSSVLAGFERHSDRAFTLHLSDPDAAFPFKLASVPASIVDGANWDSTSPPNGTGPYAVESFRANELLDLKASEHWHGIAPSVSTISIRLGASAGLPLNLFQAGEIDLLDGIPADQIALLQDPASGAVVGDVLETPLFSLTYLAFGTNDPPLDDVHVRRAIQRAFPVERFASAGNGNTAVAKGFLPPGMLNQDWEASIPGFDLDAARGELAKSRYRTASEVPPITIYSGQSSPADPLHNVGVAMQKILGDELGLTIEAVSVAWDDFLTGLPRKIFPTYSITWIADYPDPESMLWTLFGSDSNENYTGYTNPSLDAVLARAKAEREPEVRVQLYAEAQQILIDDAAVIPFFFDIGYTAVRPGIAGVPISPIGLLGFENARGRS